MTKEYYILAFLGVLIHLLKTILGRKNKNLPFSMSYLLTDGVNYLRLALAFASTFAILLMSDDIAKILNISFSDGTPAKHLLAFFAGYWNHSLIKRVVGTFNKQ